MPISFWDVTIMKRLGVAINPKGNNRPVDVNAEQRIENTL